MEGSDCHSPLQINGFGLDPVGVIYVRVHSCFWHGQDKREPFSAEPLTHTRLHSIGDTLQDMARFWRQHDPNFRYGFQ